MPELPEVEHVVRALRPLVTGSRIVATEITLPKLTLPSSPAAFYRKLKGKRITSVNRRGKYILIELDSALILVVHLRMTGQFLVLKPDDQLPKHAHAVFYLDDERRLVFRDQRQFGVMKLVSTARLGKLKGLSELAPEPFSEDFSLAYLKATFAKSRRTLKTLLLDQTRVLGLGNIYAAEDSFALGSILSRSPLNSRRKGSRDCTKPFVMCCAQQYQGTQHRELVWKMPKAFPTGRRSGRSGRFMNAKAKRASNAAPAFAA